MSYSTVAEFLTAYQIKATRVVRIANNPHMTSDQPMDHWSVRLRCHLCRRVLTVAFSMGIGHHGKAPTAAEVISCLADDASSVENASDFADWCSELGFDEDSRKAKRTYDVCVRQAAKLKAFLGPDAYDQLLYKTERL
jgi:hypothetical protein